MKTKITPGINVNSFFMPLKPNAGGCFSIMTRMWMLKLTFKFQICNSWICIGEWFEWFDHSKCEM